MKARIYETVVRKNKEMNARIYFRCFNIYIYYAVLNPSDTKKKSFLRTTLRIAFVVEFRKFFNIMSLIGRQVLWR